MSKPLTITYACSCAHTFDVACYPGHPGKLSGPPEHCYPPEPNEFDPDSCPSCQAPLDDDEVMDLIEKALPAPYEPDYSEQDSD